MPKLLKQFSYIAFMLFLISIISFLAIHIAPNSFFGAGALNPNMTKEAIEKLKAVYGLDKPLLQQYIDWFFNLIHLNFGISFVSGQDVSSEIFKRLPVTLFMNIVALLAVFAISLYLGIKSALNYEKKSDYIIRQLSLVSFSMPSFYLALLFIKSRICKLCRYGLALGFTYWSYDICRIGKYDYLYSFPYFGDIKK